MEASVIESLAALQEIDRRNRARELELAELERESGTQRTLLDEKRSVADALRAELDGLVSRRQASEAQLGQEEQRMKERRMRLGRLRNDKEVSALQREIEVAKEANARLEEEVFALIEQAEALEGGLRAAGDEAKAVEEALGRIDSAGASRTQQLRSEIKVGVGERAAIVSTLGDALRRKYEQLFQRRNGIAVVEARGGSCMGCNMQIPPQLFIRLQRRIEIETCPNCQRILFFRIESANGAGAGGA